MAWDCATVAAAITAALGKYQAAVRENNLHNCYLRAVAENRAILTYRNAVGGDDPERDPPELEDFECITRGLFEGNSIRILNSVCGAATLAVAVVKTTELVYEHLRLAQEDEYDVIDPLERI